jgi:outer membrane lipoprotein-sorting protein
MKVQVLILSILLLISCNSLNSQKELSPDVKQIINKVEAKYLSAAFYSDSGKVISLKPNSSDTLEVVHFKTTFENGGLFRFHFHKEGKPKSLYIISYDGENKAERWWELDNQKKTYNSLSSALAAARGISLRSSTIIPTMLFPGKTNEQNILQWINNRQMIEEDLNGAKYYKIMGKDKRGATYIVWISQKELFIQKIEIIQKDKSKLHYEFFSSLFDTKL